MKLFDFVRKKEDKACHPQKTPGESSITEKKAIKEHRIECFAETPNWIKNEEVYENFVALFIIDFKPYETQEVGIWETTGQPMILRHEVCNKDFSSRYALIKNLSFENVRAFAKACTNSVSISAHHFLDIDEKNWMTLFRNALGEERGDLKSKIKYSFLTDKDVSFNVDRKHALEQQLSQIDSIMNTILAEKRVVLSPDSIAEIKSISSDFITTYSTNAKHVYTFYYSEYPMSARHSKEFCKIDSVWCVYQYDYDKFPSEQQTVYPNISDNNILESFIKILLVENNYI